MKRLTTALCLAFFCMSCTNEAAKNTSAGDSTSTTNPGLISNEPAPDSATMIKNWQEYRTPGEPHKMMASWNGTWNGDISMWFTPDAPPQKSTGTAEYSMILDDRYQIAEYKGSFMGEPMLGRSTLAYDNAKKIFISTWIDNFGTGMMTMEGTWDEPTKTINFKGKMVDPSSKKDVDVREVYRIVDENTHMMEMFGPGPDGKEFKTMEVKYTRKN